MKLNVNESDIIIVVCGYNYHTSVEVHMTIVFGDSDLRIGESERV
jgi:hypothetical protein